jgi:hypothetical protein
MTHRRRGTTLVELIISLAMTGVVLALASAVLLRQHRVVSDLAGRADLAARLRDGAGPLLAQLRTLSPADLRDTRDTALEVRATIASAVVCDTIATALVLAPAEQEQRFAAVAAPIVAGDSVWALDAGTGDWRPLRILSVGTRIPGTCAALGPRLAGAALSSPRITISVMPPLGPLIGVPVRVTRPVRYSVYRAGDGAWYLGEKDWNNQAGRFDGVQPIAGPYLAPADGGVAFRYRDSLDRPLTDPVDRNAVRLLRVELRGRTRDVARALTTGPDARPRDSVLFAIALRNRP